MSTFSRILSALLLAGSFLHATPSAAAPSRGEEAPRGVASASKRGETKLRLASLVEAALLRNPSIRQAEEALRGKRFRPSTERALPDPRVGFMSTNMSNPLPFTELGEDPQANAGVSVRQEFPFPGKLELKGKVAEREVEADERALEELRLALVRDLKSAFYEYSYLFRARSILEASGRELRRLADAARVRYEVGEGSQQDLLKAELERSILEAKLVTLERRARGAGQELRAFIGDVENAPFPEPEPIEVKPVGETLPLLLERARARNPSIARGKVGIDRSRLEVDLAKREFYPDFEVGGYWGYAGDLPDMWQLNFELKVPLYHRSKQGPALEGARAALESARHEREGVEQSVSRKLEDEWAALEASKKLLDLYGRTILPASRQTLDASLKGYETGQVDFLTIYTNLLSTRDYELSREEERMNYAKARARIEALVGESSSPNPSSVASPISRKPGATERVEEERP